MPSVTAKISGSLNDDEVDDLEKEKERIAKILGITKKELFETLEPLHALYASADHLLTVLFAVTDGMLPSNSGGGYNLRMLLRRVFGFGTHYEYMLDYRKILQGHADHLNYMFPHLQNGVDTTLAIIEQEQIRYKETKQKAKSIVSNLLKNTKSNIGPKELIVLYKSHGIQPETVLEAAENSVKVEIPGNFYNLVREEEGDYEGKKKTPSVKVLFSEISSFPKTKPMYYSRTSKFKAKVLGSIRNRYIILDQTGFYPEGGGQVSDTGTMNGIKIKQVTKQSGVALHEVPDTKKFKKGDQVTCEVDLVRRKTIARHHTGAHLLNAACREILGPHIWQGGSNKDEHKAHLDITHYRKITSDELASIERKINEYIMDNLPITTEILPRNVAEENYGFTIYQGGAVPGKELRIVSIGDVDNEACGGTHTMHSNTGEIGFFKIVRREGVRDGVERIVYKCGFPAIEYVQQKEAYLKQAANVLRVPENELVRSVERFFNDWKTQRKKLEILSDLLVEEEAKIIIKSYKGKPETRAVDVDAASLKKLALQIANGGAAACVVNKAGNVVCVGNSKHSAKQMLAKLIKKLGGSGGGNDKIAQGKVQRTNL